MAPKKQASAQPAVSKPTRAKKASKYNVGDKVVHPQHGAATIAKKVKQEFNGEKLDYFVLDIATEQLTVMVPVSNIEEVIRPIISKTQARNVLKVLKEEPQEAGSNWSRWYKVLNEKIASDRIFSTLVYPNALAGVILLLFPLLHARHCGLGRARSAPLVPPLLGKGRTCRPSIGRR